MAIDKPAVATASKKKDSKSKPRSHPPYFEMISEAITTLKERSGSSQQAIQKFIENKYNDLPVNFRKLLLNSLKKFVADDKLVKVKASYKLVSPRSPTTKSDTSVAKPLPKNSTKSAPAKKSAAPEKSKAPAAKKTAEKAKVGAKRKATEKTKEKKAVAKVAKTSTRSTPAKKAVAAKVAKTSTRSTPEKKVAAAKVGKTSARSTRTSARKGKGRK